MILEKYSGRVPIDFLKNKKIKNCYFEVHPKSYSFIICKNIFYYLKKISENTKLQDFSSKLYEKFQLCFPKYKKNHKLINSNFFLYYFIFFPLQKYTVIENKVIESLESNFNDVKLNYKQLDEIIEIDDLIIKFNKLNNKKTKFSKDKNILNKNLIEYYNDDNKKILEFFSFNAAYNIFKKLKDVLPKEYLQYFKDKNFSKLNKYIDKDIVLSFFRLYYLLLDLNYCKSNYDTKNLSKIFFKICQNHKHHWYFKLISSKDAKVEKRNKDWMKEIVKPDSLFVVGEGHIKSDKNSLVHLLKKKGFKIYNALLSETFSNFKKKIKHTNDIKEVFSITNATINSICNNFYYKGLILKQALLKMNDLYYNGEIKDIKNKKKILKFYDLSITNFKKAKEKQYKISFEIKDCDDNIIFLEKKRLDILKS